MSKPKLQKLQQLQVSHIRRCHHCGEVSESVQSAIMRCQSCGKHLAPFYFFDESSLDGLDEGSLFMSTLPGTKKVQPIWGISFYWTDELGTESQTAFKKEELQLKDLHESQLRRHKKGAKKHSGRHSGHRD